MLIAVAGPYSAPTPKQRQQNLDAMNEAAAAVYRRGHVPVIGVNAALPVLEALDSEDEYEVIMTISLGVVGQCDALLLIGESPGANRERDLIQSKDRPIYRSIDEIPDASK